MLYGYRHFIVSIKTDDIYKDIAEDVEIRFDNSNYELDRLLPKTKKEKSNWINERWIKQKNDDKICWIRTKTYSYVIDDGGEDKNQKAQEVFHKKKCNSDRW